VLDDTLKDILLLPISDSSKAPAPGETAQHTRGLILDFVEGTDSFKRLRVWAIRRSSALMYDALVSTMQPREVTLI
jgi:hypothetical protein